MAGRSRRRPLEKLSGEEPLRRWSQHHPQHAHLLTPHAAFSAQGIWSEGGPEDVSTACGNLGAQELLAAPCPAARSPSPEGSCWGASSLPPTPAGDGGALQTAPAASLSPGPESPCEAVCPPCRGHSESAAVLPGDLPSEPSKMTASASHPDLLGAWDTWAEAPAPTLAADG